MRYSVGPNLFVRPLRRDDLGDRYRGWFEDPDVCKFSSHGAFPKSPGEFETFANTLHGASQIVWGIFHTDHGHIGNAALQSLSWVSRSAEFAILLGEKNYWGIGLGRSVASAIVRHGFERLNLNRIYLGTAVTNHGMVRIAESLGFLREGLFREHLFFDGRAVDVAFYGVLKSEFKCLS